MKIAFEVFITCLVVTLSLRAETASNVNAKPSTEPLTRPRIDDLQKESSSFVADPDPLDPLPLKKESLKEDEEPVLEDIKTILNSPSHKKNTEQKKSTTTMDQVNPEISSEKKTEPKLKANLTRKNITKKNKKRHSKQKKTQTLHSDQLDLTVEKKLNQIYRRYSIEPTSAELWASVTSGRKVEVFTVVKGNTLESISRTLFGDSQFWPKIWALNHTQIANPHQIYPGQKIYFFPAEGTSLPTMSLGEVTGSNVTSFEKSLDGRDYSPQLTEFEQFNIKNQWGKKNKNLNLPQPVPDSLPLVRRKEYFLKSKRYQILIDIQKTKTPNLVIPQNPYILSSSQLTTDYRASADQVDSLICHENQFVKKMLKVNPTASVGKHLIVERLSSEVSRLHKTYIYKVIGSAEIGDASQMRIKSCLQLINSDTLIVSEEKIKNLIAPTEVIGQGPQLIESVEAERQNYFNLNQFVIINSDAQTNSVGLNLNIFSEEVDAVVGKLRVVQTMGTFSIGYLTAVSQLINIGDRVLGNDDLATKTVDVPMPEPKINIE